MSHRRGADPVGTTFIFLNLLEGHIEFSTKLFLTETKKRPTQAHALADMKVDRIVVRNPVIALRRSIHDHWAILSTAATGRRVITSGCISMKSSSLKVAPLAISGSAILHGSDHWVDSSDGKFIKRRQQRMRNPILESGMAGIINEPQGGVAAPCFGKAMRGKRRTDHIMPALNDVGWQMSDDANIGQDVIRRRKAVIDEIMRFSQDMLSAERPLTRRTPARRVEQLVS